MRPAWKKVAEFAAMQAAPPDDVSNAVASALADDWRTDVASDIAGVICDVLGGQKDSLFQDQKVMQLEALRPMTAGRELAQLFLDCAIQRATTSEPGPDAAVEAAADALAIWGARHGRNIEEHYCRKSNERHAHDVRGRIEDGIGRTPLGTLARQFLNLEPRTAPRSPAKKTGLDDGVLL
jgi:hypothetical protein